MSKKNIPPPRCVNFLLNTKAFSLIEVMIAMSVVIALGYFMADMIVGQQKAITSSEVRMENIEIFRQVQTLLSDKAACEKTLAGDSSVSPFIKTVRLYVKKDSTGKYPEVAIDGGVRSYIKKDNLGVTISGSEQIGSEQAIRDRAGNFVFRKGGVYGNGAIKVTNIAVRNKSLEIKSGGREGSGTAILRFSTKILKGSLKGKTTTRNFLLQVVAKMPGNKTYDWAEITECFADTNAVISTAAEEATKQILKINGCDYDPDAETITCAGDAPITCKIETTCTSGTSIAVTKSGKHICCENTALSTQTICERMGGVYEKNTCVNKKFSFIPNARTSIVESQPTTEHQHYPKTCPNYLNIFKKCTPGYSPVDIDISSLNIPKTSAKTYTKDVHGYKVRLEKKYNGYLIRMCRNSGVNYHNIEFQMTCKESSCKGGCLFPSNSILMTHSKAASCKMLQGVYNAADGTCAVITDKTKSLSDCRVSATACEPWEVSAKNYEMWRGCFYRTFTTNLERCDNVVNNFSSDTAARLLRFWKCPGLESNYCPRPTIKKNNEYNCGASGFPQPGWAQVKKLFSDSQPVEKRLEKVIHDCKSASHQSLSPWFVPCKDLNQITGVHPTTNKRAYCDKEHGGSTYHTTWFIKDLHVPSKDKPYRCCK